MDLDWHRYFLEIAKVVAKKSSCIRRQVGAVIVRENRIISTGYNGTPRGLKNCNEGGSPRCKSKCESGTNLELSLCSHAEENAIINASYYGVALKHANIYVTLSPCLLCAKMIIQAGIKSIFYSSNYSVDEQSMKLFSEAKIECQKLELS